MRTHRFERHITIGLFFLVVLVFSIAQEKSRVIERAYSGKWKLNTAAPVKSDKAPITGTVSQPPSRID